MTLEGNHLRIPNATVFNSVILNYTRNPLRQFRFDVSIGTGEDLARAQDLGREALQSIEGVLDEPGPRALIRELGDSWVLVRYLGWVDQTLYDFAKVRGEAIRVVKESLDSAGVDMPSPEYQIRMNEQAASPASPSRQVAPRAGGPAPDLSPDPTLDRQIADDRKASPEENLLTNDKG
jgi:small-conductance mechanosensitive channel